MPEIDSSIIFSSKNKIDGKRKLSGKSKSNWVEGCLHADNFVNKSELVQRGASHLGSSFSRKKAFFFLLFIFACVGLFFFKLVYLQIALVDKYRALSENNSERIIPVPSERGLIYDRKGRLLTKNIPNFSVVIVPLDMPRQKDDKDSVIAKLASLAGIEKNKIESLLEQYNRYRSDSITVKEDIDYETALKIQIASETLPGVRIQRGSKRLYLNEKSELGLQEEPLYAGYDSYNEPFSLSHVLGYVGKLNLEELEKNYSSGYLPSDNIGKIGIESCYEAILRGKYGRKRIEVDSAGKEQSVLAEYAPEAGLNIELSIDTAMQSQMEAIMRRHLDKNNKTNGVGVAMNPRDGKIFAMVSLPSFNSNDFSGGIDSDTYLKYLNDKNKPLFNRAISGTYPPGSTIKMVFAAGALQEGIISAATSFFSDGGLRVSEWFFPDWQYGGHGWTDVKKSLAWSVNTFYYYIGGGHGNFTGLGLEKLVSYLKLFGFGSELGIDMIGEKTGFIPSREWKKDAKNESWYIGDTYNLSIGQGDLLVTPIQIALMTSAIANNGVLYKPKVINSIIRRDGSVKDEIKPEILRSNFISPNNLSLVRQGMKGCVEYGSCRLLSSLPFKSAAKTGTAQWNSNKPNHAWFTSFAPFDNPEIEVTILIEEGGEGSGISAQIAYDFYKWWWNYNKY